MLGTIEFQDKIFQLNEVVDLLSRGLTPEQIDAAVDELHETERVTVTIDGEPVTVLDDDEGYSIGWRQAPRRRRRAPLQEHPHGTYKRYSLGCSCEKCRAANAAKVASERARVDIRRMPNSAHGTLSGYDYWGCRKSCCREAKRAAKWRHQGKPYFRPEE